MIFALATDEQTLFVFATAEKAIAYCEGIDVEEGIWLFWGADGLPLYPDFIAPSVRRRFSVTSGVYRLLPVPALSNRPLTDFLGDICSLSPNPFFASLASVTSHLGGTA